MSRFNSLCYRPHPPFPLQCIVKIVAMGFISNTGSYINDRWNKLDFLVVITSLLTVDDSSFLPNVSSLRTFRVLRPLRSLSSVSDGRRNE